ncbi:MAG: cohesin domain-containing protein, partial [Candidatus Poribacteria bacterium]
MKALATVDGKRLAGTITVWRSDDEGATWVSDDAGIVELRNAGNPITGLTAVGDTLYAATSDAGVFAAYAGGPVADIAPNPLDLGTTPVGVAVTATLTVTNGGSDTLSVNGVTSTAAPVTVDLTTFDVAPAESQPVIVTFLPTTTGAQTADIVFTHNAAAGSTTVAATGTATAPLTSINITAPTEGQTLPPGTSAVSLTVDIEGHSAPGHWHWQLDTPFPASGVAGGLEVAAGTNSATVAGLTDGTSYTAYVTLVDGEHNVLATPVEDSGPFSVDALPGDAVQVLSTQGAAGATVSVPITIYDVLALNVTGVDLTLTYDATVLTPTSDAGVTTAFTFGDGVTPTWSMEQNVVTPGQLEVVMGGAFDSPLTGVGVLAYVAFNVAVGATADATSALGLTRADLNEGGVPSTAVDGVFTVVNFMLGDVTGNGVLTGFDASHVLEHVAQEPFDLHHTFPVEIVKPVWAPLPLTHDEAHVVANVSGDPADAIFAMDATHILRRAVSIITSFPVEGGAAPSGLPIVSGYGFTASATSARPGARIVVSLEASGVRELYAGELRLDYDPSLLTLVDVSVASSASAKQPVLVAERDGDGHVAVAFASARSIDTAQGALHVTFEIPRGSAQPATGAIRASHLRLNGSLVQSDFEYRFSVE